MQMWDEAYLESCCRSALHRVVLSGDVGRPAGQKDCDCHARLEALDLVGQRSDGRYAVTKAGQERHGREVLGHRAAAG